jgi:NNP family nitrate/nitrite transporter-like MFS transporter
MVVGHGIIQPFSGLIYARLGPARALPWGLAYLTLVSLLVMIPDWWPLMAAARTVQGLGTGALFVIGTAYIAAHSSPAQVRSRQAWYGGMTGVGAALAFALAPVAVGLWGWRGAYALPFGLVLLTDIALAAAPRGHTAPASAVPIGWAAYRRLLGEGRVWRLGLAHAGSFGVFVALGSWLTTLYLRATGGDRFWSAELAALVLALGGLARLAGSPAAARVGDRALIVGSLAAAALSLAALGLGLPPVAEVVLALVAVWCCSFTFAGVFHLIYATSRPGEAATVVALVNTVTLAAGMVLPALFGLLADATGTLGAGFIAYAAVSGAGALAVLLWRTPA